MSRVQPRPGSQPQKIVTGSGTVSCLNLLKSSNSTQSWLYRYHFIATGPPPAKATASARADVSVSPTDAAAAPPPPTATTKTTTTQKVQYPFIREDTLNCTRPPKADLGILPDKGILDTLGTCTCTLAAAVVVSRRYSSQPFIV